LLKLVVGIGFGYDFSPQVSLAFTYDHYAQEWNDAS
jgi:hypothetical protein